MGIELCKLIFSELFHYVGEFISSDGNKREFDCHHIPVSFITFSGRTWIMESRILSRETASLHARPREGRISLEVVLVLKCAVLRTCCSPELSRCLASVRGERNATGGKSGEKSCSTVDFNIRIDRGRREWARRSSHQKGSRLKGNQPPHSIRHSMDKRNQLDGRFPPLLGSRICCERCMQK